MRNIVTLLILILVSSCVTREPLDPLVAYGNANTGQMAIDVEWRENATDEEISKIGIILGLKTLATCLEWGYNDYDSVDYQRSKIYCSVYNDWIEKCEITGATFYKQCTNS